MSSQFMACLQAASAALMEEDEQQEADELQGRDVLMEEDEVQEEDELQEEHEQPPGSAHMTVSHCFRWRLSAGHLLIIL